MIDAFKNLGAGNKRDAVVSERHELEQLIQAARAERAAMDEALLSLRQRSASLTPIARLLDNLAEKMTGAVTRLDEIGARLSALDARTGELERLGGQIQDLQAAAGQAEQRFRDAAGFADEVRKQRQAIDELSSRTLQTRASLDALNGERAAFEELRGQLRAAQTEIRQSADGTRVLDGELSQLRGIATGLTEELSRLGETSRAAREDASAAAAAIKEAEKKLESVTGLQALGQDVEERLAALNALAERVSLKAKAIESQQLTVEHALVQSNRVQEMVGTMERQIATLSEGMKQTATAGEALDRLEKLAADTAQRLAAAARLHADTEQQAARLEQRAGSLFGSLHTQLETLAVDKKAVEALDERLRVLDGAIGRAEARMGALAGQEKDLAGIAQGVEGASKRLGIFSCSPAS
jgi:DNA repair exonuclease SbcCD ATPase subunit